MNTRTKGIVADGDAHRLKVTHRLGTTIWSMAKLRGWRMVRVDDDDAHRPRVTDIEADYLEEGLENMIHRLRDKVKATDVCIKVNLT